MRPLSLFVSLLLAQGMLAAALTVTLAVIFYGERNITVAQLVATVWSPTLKLLDQGAPFDAVVARAPGPLQIRTARPNGVLKATAMAPRLALVREQLQKNGIPIRGAMFGLTDESSSTTTQVWLELQPVNGNERWVGFDSRWVETQLGERILLAVSLIVGFAILASAIVARRLAKPLESLRTRIAADDSSGSTVAHATVEILAIDEAWRNLRWSLDRQERERALLLAGVSHDLRSPLGRIRMAAELLPELESVASGREAIVRNTMLADRLVGNFLDHVRSGELPMDEVVDLTAIARRAVDQQNRSKADLVFDAPTTLLVSNANASLTERAISNLLENAFAHGLPPVHLRVMEQGGEVIIEVQDQGSGIDPDQEVFLFQAFARSDSSRQRPGLGLGLSVVQRVTERMGGTVRFKRAADGSSNIVRMHWPISL
jgi:two-component system, OmpR family, osmolarity sensor histidine kinase EnvZ